jgi:hypothetical protein
MRLFDRTLRRRSAWASPPPRPSVRCSTAPSHLARIRLESRIELSVTRLARSNADTPFVPPRVSPDNRAAAGAVADAAEHRLPIAPYATSARAAPVCGRHATISERYARSSSSRWAGVVALVWSLMRSRSWQPAPYKPIRCEALSALYERPPTLTPLHLM